MDQLKPPPAASYAKEQTLPPGLLVASYSNRKDLNEALTFLAAHQFPIQSLYILGDQPVQVEYIAGQATYPRAALAGLWQGLTLGSLAALLNSTLSNTPLMVNLATILPIAIAFCMIYAIFLASRSGGKGIGVRPQLLSARYQLMALPQVAEAARQILARPQAPRPAGAQIPGYPQQAPMPPAAQPASPQAPAAGQPGQAQAQDAQEAAFQPPAQTLKDGSPAASRYGLRIEDPEEYRKTIRQAPEKETEQKEQ